MLEGVETVVRSSGALRNNPVGSLPALPSGQVPRALELHRILWTARWVDQVEMELIHRGEAFFHVGGAGHEASAALAAHLDLNDWLHLHYRDKALMLARGVPPSEFFHSLLCTGQSHSQGRQMSAHLSAPHLKVLSLVGPVGNNALQAVGIAHELADRRATGSVTGPPAAGREPVVVCALGDGTTQQGEVLEAIAEAVRARLRVLFLVEDNHLAISTRTRGQTFYDLPTGPATEFYGLPILRLDGRDPMGCDGSFRGILSDLRKEAGPALVVLQVERLTHHTNADDERQYRASDELETVRQQADPLQWLEKQLAASGVSRETLEQVAADAEAAVRAAAEEALRAPDPDPVRDACAPMPADPGLKWEVGTGQEGKKDRNGVGPVPTFGSEAGQQGNGKEGERWTLLESLRRVLDAHLGNDPRVCLFGQDLEDPKGDVFGLTRGLTRAHPGQVRNSALSESTIVGVCIGRALAGGRPIASIQFADFLPLAFNQIASELGSLYWRTAGGWRAPVVILAPCGGYRPGLGPFHAQTFESTFAHVPGLDVVMPSTARDAAGLLNAALEGGRPTLFLYPKVLLNDASVAWSAEADARQIRVRPGTARRVVSGNDLTLVTWGATVSLAERACRALAEAGIEVDLLDLRSLSPWDREAVLESVRRTRRLLVIHEDNLTCGFGAEVLATALEQAGVPLEARRVTRPDTYVPCNYKNQLSILPSLRTVLEAAAALCSLDLEWEFIPENDQHEFILEAAGSSPADQNVTVLEWRVAVGDTVQEGDLLAECEADKATFELRAPVSGRLLSLHPAGETVDVGHPLARIERATGTPGRSRRIPKEPVPIVRKRPADSGTARNLVSGSGRLATDAPTQGTPAVVRTALNPGRATVGLTGFHFVTGSTRMTNEDLLARFPGKTSEDIVQRTGIQTRYFCGPDETVLTLASRAARAALEHAGMTLADLDGILVSTSTPLSISPSLACLLHYDLSQHGPARDIPASDILAACSGWLYALQTAFDQCQIRPESKILVVTAEAMSRFLDPDDFDTAIVFGDAATATIVHGLGADGSPARPSKELPQVARLHRPLLSARGEDGDILNLGRMEGGCYRPVEMHGVRVFPLAVRQMNQMLRQACQEAGWGMDDLQWIVPHQANGRIIAAAQQRSGVPAERVVSNVACYGNTSSSSIPIALAEMVGSGQKGKTAIAAFGGGFTFGAAVMELV